MADVSSVSGSGSGAVPPSQNVQSHQPAAPTDEAASTNAANFDQQQDDALDFLSQELTQGIAAQKTNLR